MTLADGKRKVLMLLDEYSAGGTITPDEDINYKMNDFFDMAQKDIANYRRILRTENIELTPETTEYDLPEDFGGLCRIWRYGRPSGRFSVRPGKKLSTPAGLSGTITVDYYAIPGDITPETGDEYIFEVGDDAAACLPFFVTAQHLLPDLVVDYGAFWQMYLTMRAQLSADGGSGSGGGVRQLLYS